MHFVTFGIELQLHMQWKGESNISMRKGQSFCCKKLNYISLKRIVDKTSLKNKGPSSMLFFCLSKVFDYANGLTLSSYLQKH